MTSIRKISIALSSPRSTHVRVENMVKRGTTRFPVVSSDSHSTYHSIAKLTDHRTQTQARIKKLIQADEDVGKVAQGVPVVVCQFLSSHYRIYDQSGGDAETLD